MTIMKRFPFLSLIAMCLLTFSSCKKEQKSSDIIVKKQVAKVDKGIQKMAEKNIKRDVEWIGATYKICIECKADTSLRLAVDESGNKYYDNRVRLSIRRPDGSEFFDRTFTKADFAQYVEGANKEGALLGIVFDNAETDCLRFAASVGSPDRMSDEYVPLVLMVSRTGGVMISKDTKLDTTNDADLDDDEGV